MANEVGTLVALMLSCACLTYLTHKSWGVIMRRRSFSMRDMLVVCTLFAALMGLIVGLMNQDKDGMPRHLFWSDIYRLYGQNAQPEQ